MDAKKKNAPAEGASNEAKKPIKIFSAGDVSASTFRHEYGGRVNYNTSFTRWYRDKNGQNRYINSFSLEDLGKVASVAQKADEYIRELQAA